MSFACILESMRGHSALRLKSRICAARGVDEPYVLSPCSPRKNPNLSSQILECLAESSPTDFKEVSESTLLESYSTSESAPSDSHSVIASEAKQSIKIDSESMDCRAGKSARNDDKAESAPHASPESKTDSESPSGEVYPLRDKNKIARSANLEGVVGVGGLSRGEGATSPNSSPSPLDEKEKEILKNSGILEAKAKDSEKIDSESENQVESAMVGYSEKRDLESDKLESATDSEFRNLASRDTSLAAQYDNNSDSKKVDCHDFAPAKSRNDKHTKSQANFQKINSHAFPKLKPRNASRLDSKGLTKSVITRDSKKHQVPKSHTLTQQAPRPLTPRLAFHTLHYSKCAHIHHKALAC